MNHGHRSSSDAAFCTATVVTLHRDAQSLIGHFEVLLGLLNSHFPQIAAAALGLDPGIGFLHVDTDARDSLACDLMEPGRPQVDSFLLRWITSQPLRREWFFEQRDGGCRLMASFAVQLSQTARTWAHSVAPLAEWVSRVLWSTVENPRRRASVPTYLTQTRRREAKRNPIPITIKTLNVPAVCKSCGVPVQAPSRNCASCAVVTATETLIRAAKQGRLAAHTNDAARKRGATITLHKLERSAWNQKDLPVWLTEKSYIEEIQPHLARVPVRKITATLEISKQYALQVRRGKRIPHPRHWQKLATMMGVDGPAKLSADDGKQRCGC